MIFFALDDERPALKSLVSSIRKVKPDSIVYEFDSALTLLDFAKEHKFDAAFLDIQGVDLDGVTLAKKLKKLNPKSNIVFCTGYSDYAVDAFDLDASAYLLKPITPAKIEKAIAQLRYDTSSQELPIKSELEFRCFGNFEIFVNGKPIEFKYSKSKELVAYLYDKRGAMCTNNEIMTYLWEDDDDHLSYLKQIRKDVDDTLKACGHEDLIIKQIGKIAIDFDSIESDLKEWQKGNIMGINAYRGEYMSQYSWAEETNGLLSKD